MCDNEDGTEQHGAIGLFLTCHTLEMQKRRGPRNNGKAGRVEAC